MRCSFLFLLLLLKGFCRFREFFFLFPSAKKIIFSKGKHGNSVIFERVKSLGEEKVLRHSMYPRFYSPPLLFAFSSAHGDFFLLFCLSLQNLLSSFPPKPSISLLSNFSIYTSHHKLYSLLPLQTPVLFPY